MFSRNPNNGRRSKTDIPVRPIHVRHLKSVVQAISTSRQPVKPVVRKKFLCNRRFPRWEVLTIAKSIKIKHIICSDICTGQSLSSIISTIPMNRGFQNRLLGYFKCVRKHLPNNWKLQTSIHKTTIIVKRGGFARVPGFSRQLRSGRRVAHVFAGYGQLITCGQLPSLYILPGIRGI